jgi:hypothetical protein
MKHKSWNTSLYLAASPAAAMNSQSIWFQDSKTTAD